MHEASIMQSVFDIAFAQIPLGSTARIVRLRLRVGDLAGVAVQSLAFAFEAMKGDTPAALAEMEVERVPARLRCRDCHREFEPDDFPAACPGCGSWAAEVQVGQELDLVLVEIEG